MKTFSITVLTTFILASNCFALEKPKGSKADTRIQTVAYNEKQVVEVNCYPGIATHIVFSPEERILDIASGFTKGWEFSPQRNNLYLKPKAEKADTNLIVVTNKHNYSFYLVLRPNKSSDQVPEHDPDVAFRVEFTYPGDDQKKLNAAVEKELVKDRLARKNAPRNWNYTMQVGPYSANIAPTMAYDDGRFTYLQFPNNREIPAVFFLNPDNSETLVNTHFEGSTLVVHQVSPSFMLRLGNSLVGIYNEAYDPDGVAPKKGVTVSGVKRVIEGEK